ncbi:MAG: bifunctional glutamate N-acetyltransferase/amino-acid acetyltransferase ArgJ [Proteobacteria bacterium]|nr:bifunctional glutamate N-acetyltransferase/amino-acid acetyltransferase ArgJ [Pseudomonadota bacterium]
MAKIKRSPLAPKSFPRLPEIAGVRIASRSAGLRYSGRRDLFIAQTVPGTAVAGVLTRSKTASAPVEWCREVLRGGAARGLVVNAGNSNAFTGQAGREAVAMTAESMGQLSDCRASEVLVASTGVIGEQLSAAKIIASLPGACKDLRRTGWRNAAEAIRTTDTFPKGAVRYAKIAGKEVRLVGIAKGSGMIAPDMATMLAFLFTDATIPASVLRPLLRTANQQTFNAITVDGDTSTSDTVLLFATGCTRHARITSPTDQALTEFRNALKDLMLDLAHQIIRDGEGATKFVTILVRGAENNAAARRIAMAVANSPLVKTAIAGEDPNWGRIVMAVGKAGEAADRDRLAIDFGDIAVARNGERVPGYVEADAARYMKRQNIEIAVDVGVGRGRFTAWTCDLTHDYISINADYRS